MNTLTVALLVAILVVILAIVGCYGREGFDIPVGSSSAWGWNTGPGYGAGYGTGYAMWGVWPKSLPRVPWKNWMWGRRPDYFVREFTPVPQIDYNNTREDNYNVSLLPTKSGVRLSVNGFAGKTLQLDRGRVYYFHVYTPGANFVISSGDRDITAPVDRGTVKVVFEESDPEELHYSIVGIPHTGGKIYLNSIR